MIVRNQWARRVVGAGVRAVVGAYALLAFACAPQNVPSAVERDAAMEDAALERVACAAPDTGIDANAVHADASAPGDAASASDATMAAADAASEPDASQPDRPITVALTFDDTHVDQLLAVPALARHGFHATFFVNSPRFGRSGYFTLANARELEAAGHEIGGHTITHGDLTLLSEADQRKEICDDRNALVAHGFEARSFAYPRGLQNTISHRVAQSCGYDSARLVSGAACK
jgi:hypothetical protein